MPTAPRTERDNGNGAFDHYPVVNWIALKVVLGEPPAGALSLLDRSEVSARERFARSRDTMDAIFDAVAPADVAVVRALMNSTLAGAGDDRHKEIERIAGLYRDVFQRVQATNRQENRPSVSSRRWKA